jgi:rhodanese-related sulfurtransferase
MNSFLKANLLWLSLLGVAVILVVLAFILRPNAPQYQIGASETLKWMNQPQMEVAIDHMDGKQLIDIRPVDSFLQGHAENAINIPVRNLLDQESVSLFDELRANGKEAIIYGSDELQATAPWLLLQQLGYQNIKILKGGYSSDQKFMEPVLSSTESMQLDIEAIHLNSQPIEVSSVKPENKKSEAVIPVRKKGTSGGGC